MKAKPVLRILLLPPGLIAVAGLLRFAAIALDQAFRIGLGEGLMMAWTLLFVVALPLLLIARWVGGEIGRQRRRRRIIPHVGVKIP
jgi:hypothetical protein